MTRKAMALLSLMAVLVLVFGVIGCGCSRDGSSNNGSPSDSTVVPTDESDGADQATDESDDVVVPVEVDYDDDDMDSSPTRSNMTYIKLEGSSIAVEGSGATVSGCIVTITSAGAYSISGMLNDGQVVVDAGDSDVVKLVLNGADITCSNSAAICVISADKTVITLAEGTANYVTDGSSYVFADASTDEPNAAVFSKDDLTINGAGSLTVNANYSNGIQSKDDLKITGGNITVNAVNDGIKGRDCVAISGGTITVKAGGDGMQSTNDEDAAKGFVCIGGGTINITAGADGVQAETSLLVTNGTITMTCGGGSAETVSSSASAKAVKAAVDITIEGGTFAINSADDAIHSNNSITINGGTIALASGDDGIHADSTIVINGGEITTTKCYEGIESGVVTIDDGNIHIVASDDGMNILAGYLYINGGYVFVNAGGDGFDVNPAIASSDPIAGGSLVMTGGTVIIDGPRANQFPPDGALDFGTFKMTGGFLVAVGSSDMAQAPGTSSTQYSVMVNFTSAIAAGTMVHIQAQDGTDVLTFVPTKAYQSVALCSAQLQNGTTYAVYTGGSSTGTATDCLYSGGTYTPGTQYTTFTISSIVTTIGSTGGGGGPPGPRR